MIRKRPVVSGRVQRVGYRAWFHEHAVALDLDGWVRNRVDGSVEAIVRGPADRVAEMARRARQGPPLSRVVDVMVGDDVSIESLVGFVVR